VTGPDNFRPGVPDTPLAARPVITRIGEDDWRVWRDVRLAALADAPEAFGSGPQQEQALPENDWRAMTRTAAIFVATADGTSVGVVAGLPRESPGERGLGAMWVAPLWRGRGVAAALAGAVITWARSEGCARIGLWVPADSPRARRFYQRQGFRATGQARPFPDDATRVIDEMVLGLV
jgi:GNAT superfamily N-acetyltransferase